MVVVDVPGVGSEDLDELGPRGQLVELVHEPGAIDVAGVELGTVAERHVQVDAGDGGAVEERVHLVAGSVEPRLRVRGVGRQEEEVARLEGLSRLLALVVALREDGDDPVVAAGDERVLVRVHLIPPGLKGDGAFPPTIR